MAEGRWVRITPGFLLTMAVMFWLDEGVGLLGWGVLACVVHELGHLLVGAALGGRPRWLSLSAVGLELNMEYPAGLSYGRELAVALAGPAVNLVTGGICAQFGNYLLAGVSFGLGLFNLMPVLPLDGGRALWAVGPIWGTDGRAGGRWRRRGFGWAAGRHWGSRGSIVCQFYPVAGGGMAVWTDPPEETGKNLGKSACLSQTYVVKYLGLKGWSSAQRSYGA